MGIKKRLVLNWGGERECRVEEGQRGWINNIKNLWRYYRLTNEKPSARTKLLLLKLLASEVPQTTPDITGSWLLRI